MKPRFKLLLIMLAILMGVALCVMAIVLRTDSDPDEEGKTVGVILAGPRADYGWSEVTGSEYAETMIGKDRVILFDNLNESVYPDLDVFDVVTNMQQMGARAFFISAYTPEETAIARRYPNTVFIHNIALRWDVEDMLPNLIIVTTSRDGPPPPGTTPDDITVWIFGIGGLLAAALLVFAIGYLNAQLKPATPDGRNMVTRLIARISEEGEPKKKRRKPSGDGIHAKELLIERAAAERATNFAALGEPEPILHELSTYVQGDRHFDESFAIEPNKVFHGECGVGMVSRANLNDPNRSAALEIWLFDKNDIKTVTRFVVSEYVLQDSVLYNKLKGRGDVIAAEQDAITVLETKTLRLQARILEMQYGYDPALPARSFFDHIVIELAVWSKQ